MQDRTPTPGQEGRALITPEDGSPAYYAKISMADNPTQEGTPYDKSNVLQDITCDAIGIPHTSTPNEAFLALALGAGKYGFIVTVLFPDGSPVQSATLTGVSGLNGESAVTNADGVAIGVSNSNSANIGVTSPYIDFGDAAGTLIQSTGILTTVEITLNAIVAEISSSKEIVFSPVAKTADFCGIGAGAGANRFDEGPTGNGGGGGYVQNLLNYSLDGNNRTFSVVIGAGGSVGSNGGATSVSVSGDQILKADGGYTSTAEDSAAIGNGNGGVGKSLYRDATQEMVFAANGSPSSGYKFNDPALGVPGSGGGGGCLYVGATSPISVTSLPSGGSPNGGLGGYVDSTGNHNGTSGVYPGGGGGTGPYQAYKGANGCLFVRAHYPWEVT